MVMFDGRIRIFTGVRYVPKLRTNLISLGTLGISCFLIIIYKETIKVTRDDRTLMSGSIRNGLYILDGYKSFRIITFVASKFNYIPKGCIWGWEISA